MESFLNLFEHTEEIIGGYSQDRLFKCVDDYENSHLCRFFDIKQMSKASQHYEVLRSFKGQLGFQHVEYILKCQDGIHGVIVYEWVKGESLEEYLKNHPNEAFELGQQAGKLLHQLHQSSFEQQSALEYQHKRLAHFENGMKQSLEQGVYFEGIDSFFEAFDQLKPMYRVDKLVQCHGDFHARNMIINHKKEITLIDFEKCQLGDVSDDFQSLIFFDPIDFILGVLDSYPLNKQQQLNCKVHLMASPRSIVWASQFGADEVQKTIDFMRALDSKLNTL